MPSKITKKGDKITPILIKLRLAEIVFGALSFLSSLFDFNAESQNLDFLLLVLVLSPLSMILALMKGMGMS